MYLCRQFRWVGRELSVSDAQQVLLRGPETFAFFSQVVALIIPSFSLVFKMNTWTLLVPIVLSSLGDIFINTTLKTFIDKFKRYFAWFFVMPVVLINSWFLLAIGNWTIERKVHSEIAKNLFCTLWRDFYIDKMPKYT